MEGPPGCGHRVGVGAATAGILAGWGARVAVNYRDKARRAEQVVAGIVEAGGEAFAVGADVTDPDAVAAMVERVGERFGKLDLLVLNAEAAGGLVSVEGFAAEVAAAAVAEVETGHTFYVGGPDYLA